MKKQDEKEMAIVIEKMNQDYKNLAKKISGRHGDFKYRTRVFAS